MEAEIRMAPSRVSHVPEVTSATRSKLLTRIMRDQTTFLNTRTQPSADFGREDLAWYWESSDKRTRNLEYMYRTILVHCTSKQPLEDPRVLNALGALCEGSLKDPTYANVRFGLPNWFTAALLLWMTLMHGAMEGPAAAGGGQGSRNVGTEAPPAAGGDKQGQQQGEGKKGRGGPRLHREVFAPFVLQQCRPQVEAFLMIVDNQLAAEEFLYIHIRDRPESLIWVSRSGLPPLPAQIVLTILRHVKRLFAKDVEMAKLAVRAERTLEAVMQNPPTSDIAMTIEGGGGKPRQQQQQQQQQQPLPRA